MPFSSRTSASSRLSELAAQRAVHAALTWLHANPGEIMGWQSDLCSIPAPPFGEDARSAWMKDRLLEMGLEQVEMDGVGNVSALIPTPHLAADSSGPVVVLSAHLDIVFPAETPLHPVVRIVDGHERLESPGASDNAAGVAGMLAVVKAIMVAGVALPCPLLVVGNVGEEGEGDLRGVRHLYTQHRLAGRIVAHIVLDGAGNESAVTQALGSKRYQVTVRGPGGHSFTDAGTANPIVALSAALVSVAETLVPEEPRTTVNVGTIHGGTSVNSIPESAIATVDFRSTSTDQLVRLEVALHRAVEDAVDYWNVRARRASPHPRGNLSFSISKIGDRPAAQLPEDSPVLEAIRAVDRHLGLKTGVRVGSTDANIPMSLGIPAVSLGAGGDGGGAHTLAEWYSAKNRDIGLRRVLLLTLSMMEWASEQ